MISESSHYTLPLGISFSVTEWFLLFILLFFHYVSLHSALSTVVFVLPYSLIKKHIRQPRVNEKTVCSGLE